MLNINVPLSSVPLAGSDAPGNALLDLGQHGFVLFLGPDAQSPLVDIDGTVEQLVRVIRELRTGLASRRSSDAEREWTAMKPHRAVPCIES